MEKRRNKNWQAKQNINLIHYRVIRNGYENRECENIILEKCDGSCSVHHMEQTLCIVQVQRNRSKTIKGSIVKKSKNKNKEIKQWNIKQPLGNIINDIMGTIENT